MPTDPPVDDTPILLSPATFDRHEKAAKYVLGEYKTRVQRHDRSRHSEVKPGAWGLLEAGDTITAGAGLILGTGTVTLCTLDGTTLTATGNTVPVYNSGKAIDGAKVLPLEWTEIGWSVCECGETPVDCGVCCATCLPCPIPKADLGSSISLGGTTWTHTLPFDNGWTSPCFFVPSLGAYYRYKIGCVSGSLEFSYSYWPTSSCSGSPTATNSQAPISSTCNPFHVTFAQGTITGPAYGATTCCQTFRVLGCGPGVGCAISGSTVSVYSSSGGTLLASGTTRGNGQVTLLWSGSCNVYVTATDPSGSGTLAPYGQSLILTAGGSKDLKLLPSSGNFCFTSCAGACCYNALPATLNATTPLGGTTLTHQASGTYGAGWYGIQSWTPPAGQLVVSCTGTNVCVCGSGTIHMGWYFDGCTLNEVWGGQHCAIGSGCGGFSGTNDGLADLTLSGGTFAAVTPSGCLSIQTGFTSQNMAFGQTITYSCSPFSFSMTAVGLAAPVLGAFTITP